MDKRISYLTERKYKRMNIQKDNTIKSQHWNKLLGEDIVERISKNLSYFSNFINEDFFEIKEIKSLKSYSEEEFNFTSVDKYLFQMNKIEDNVYFAEFYENFLICGTERLYKMISEKQDYFSETIYSDFASALALHLQEICIRTLIAQMHFYEQKNLLQGNSEKDVYHFFCSEIINKAEFRMELFEQYPVLFRCIENKINQLVFYYTEVITHFIKDRKKIQERLCKDVLKYQITNIEGGLSDTHNNGKHVLRISVNNEVDILYKPRSMRNEETYQKLLIWLSDKLNIKQYNVPFISYEDYSWSSLVEYKSCKSKKELELYYTRFGVQLFVTYLLGTKDLHCENIIAYGQYPVLVDLEVLMNVTSTSEMITVNDEIRDQLANSILYTGLLPFYHWNQDGKGINSSGISGIDGQRYPFKIPVIANGKTSRMRMEYEYPKSKKAQNLATANGIFYEPYKFKKELLDGFTKAYLQALFLKNEIREQLKSLYSSKIRFLSADTQRYSMLLSSSYHPSLLMDGANREVFLYSLWKGREDEYENIVSSEVKSLLNGDIPYFYYKADTTELYNQREIIEKSWFPHTAMKEIDIRLNKIDVPDLRRQQEFIHLSLGLMPAGKGMFKNNVYPINTRNFQSEEADEGYALEDLIYRIVKYAYGINQKQK